MSNAAIAYHSDAFNTALRLMGRQAAGESFLKGFLRHASVDQFWFLNWSTDSDASGDAGVRAIEPPTKPVNWISRHNRKRLSEPGCLFISSPANAREAWNRRLLGGSAYSICGITHTTASARSMDALAAMLLSPVEPWDALICTSNAVKTSTAGQLDTVMEFLRERFGSIRTPPLRLETIPLGLNADDFDRSEQHRADWRRRLGIQDDAIAVLYVGRFSFHGKMNPVPMAIALERAAQRTRRPVHWILSGWASNDHIRKIYDEVGPRHAPSVTTHIVNGRLPEVRFPIWSAADLFLSLSDNIQETFGQTPIEAMAAGLPAVVSDWDGYRDLVRDGIDGFRIPTVAARPGFGGDLAVAHANEWETYDRYIGAVSQFVAPDIDATVEALVELFENTDLRTRMGAAARERARTVYDWKTVVPQYQALWAELAAIRIAAPPRRSGGLDPWRPDPFTLFASYPTRSLDPASTIALSPGVTVEAILAMQKDETTAYAAEWVLRPNEILAVVAAIEAIPDPTVALVCAALPPPRRGVAERSLIWMAKFGFVILSPRLELDRG